MATDNHDPQQSGNIPLQRADSPVATTSRASLLWSGALIAAIAVVLWRFGPEVMALASDASQSAAVKELQSRSGQMPEPLRSAATLVVTTFDQYRGIARLWSGLYNGFVLAASALGLIAALVLKLETFATKEAGKKDLSAILASTGAILAALSASGDFQMKWQANRVAAAEVESIAFVMLAPTPPDVGAVYVRLRDVSEERHLRLVSSKRPGDGENAGTGQNGSAAASPRR